MSKAANNPELHDQQTRSMRACSTQALAEARDTAAHAITQERKHIERRNVVAIFAMVVVLLVVAAIELACGASAIDIPTSIAALFGQGSASDIAAVQGIRLPRVVCAIISGAGLAIAGAVLQSVLENPLASASTVGISQGAGFGATFAILMVVPAITGSSASVNMGMTALFAFAGAMISSLVVLAFSRLGLLRPESIILVGVALSALFAGASTILSSQRSCSGSSAIFPVQRGVRWASCSWWGSCARSTSSSIAGIITRCKTAAMWPEAWA